MPRSISTRTGSLPVSPSLSRFPTPFHSSFKEKERLLGPFSCDRPSLCIPNTSPTSDSSYSTPSSPCFVLHSLKFGTSATARAMAAASIVLSAGEGAAVDEAAGAVNKAADAKTAAPPCDANKMAAALVATLPEAASASAASKVKFPRVVSGPTTPSQPPSVPSRMDKKDAGSEWIGALPLVCSGPQPWRHQSAGACRHSRGSRKAYTAASSHSVCTWRSS